MKDFAENEYEAMNEALAAVCNQQINELQKAGECYSVVLTSLDRLKTHCVSYIFISTEEEVYFFKEIKPKFVRELIYYSELYYLEAGMPVAGTDVQAVYLQHISERIRSHFERNKELWNYHRSGKTYHDELYYTRNADVLKVGPEPFADLDNRCCTVMSLKLSKLLAFEMLQEHITERIYQLQHPEASAKDKAADFNISWTDSKVDLIEVGYGLFAKGAINNGKASLKLIMGVLSSIFKVELGNYYAVIQQNIRLRKRKERTFYLNSMAESSERRMDELDENPVRG